MDGIGYFTRPKIPSGQYSFWTWDPRIQPHHFPETPRVSNLQFKGLSLETSMSCFPRRLFFGGIETKYPIPQKKHHFWPTKIPTYKQLQQTAPQDTSTLKGFWAPASGEGIRCCAPGRTWRLGGPLGHAPLWPAINGAVAKVRPGVGMGDWSMTWRYETCSP